MLSLHESGTASPFSPAIWHRASTRLLAKLVEEFAYERIFEVVRDAATGEGRATLPDGSLLTFEGRSYVFDNWWIEPSSIRHARPNEAPRAIHDPLAFCVDVLPLLGVKPMTIAHFVRELGNTLLADAHILANAGATGAELAAMDDARLEGETTGHPWITVSKGRIGLGYDDYLAFAPESRRDLKVLWIGVDARRAAFAAVPGTTNAMLAQDALGPTAHAAFREALARRAGPGEAGRDYLMMPVHPWQWERFLVPHFASDIAAGDIVLLGEGPDLYRPQQSVRTVSNLSHPEKSTLKLCMTMLNTAVYRGIPGKRALAAASLTAWLDTVVAADPFLSRDCRLVLLGERAGMHYVHPQFARIEGAPYQFNEMLGCLWRDSLPAHLEPGENGVPLAALLHEGADGVPVAAALARRSGRPLDEWVERFLAVLLPPVIHLLARHGLGFSAHGQNATLILREGWPERLALRDFVDDVNVCDLDFPESAAMPEDVRAVLLRLPPDYMLHFVQTTLFVCVLRYVSVLLDRRCGYSESAFWQAARRVVERYQARFPELADRFALFDLFTPDYPRLCLNRVRLFTHGYADDDERPVPDFAGTVRNPLTAFA